MRLTRLLDGFKAKSSRHEFHNDKWLTWRAISAHWKRNAFSL